VEHVSSASWPSQQCRVVSLKPAARDDKTGVVASEVYRPYQQGGVGVAGMQWGRGYDVQGLGMPLK